MICQIITNLYNKYDFLLESGYLNEKEQAAYQQVSADMENYMAAGRNRWILSKDFLMPPLRQILSLSAQL